MPRHASDAAVRARVRGFVQEPVMDHGIVVDVRIYSVNALERQTVHGLGPRRFEIEALVEVLHTGADVEWSLVARCWCAVRGEGNALDVRRCAADAALAAAAGACTTAAACAGSSAGTAAAATAGTTHAAIATAATGATGARPARNTAGRAGIQPGVEQRAITRCQRLDRRHRILSVVESRFGALEHLLCWFGH